MKKQNTIFTFHCLWHGIAILPFYFVFSAFLAFSAVKNLACRGVAEGEDGSIKNNKLCKTNPIPEKQK